MTTTLNSRAQLVAAAIGFLLLVTIVPAVGTPLIAHAVTGTQTLPPGQPIQPVNTTPGTTPGAPVTTPAPGTAPATPTSGGTLANPLKVDSINALLDLVLAAAVNIGSIILTLAIIWTGFKFVAARGNEEKIRSARTALMWTVIGGLILLGATGIKAVITSTITSVTT